MAMLTTNKVLKPEHGTEIRLADNRLRITTELQPSADIKDVAAHLRALAKSIEEAK